MALPLKMPPLRERTDEIPILSQHFMRKVAAKYGCAPLPISPELLQALTGHSWPGNLRELENTIKRYLVLSDEQTIIEELTPPESTEPPDRSEEESRRRRLEAHGAEPEGRRRICRNRSSPGGYGLEPEVGRERSANQL